MKRITVTFVSLFAFAVFFWNYSGIRNGKENAVNAVLGDVSFESKFGFAPDGTTDENLRITTHLEYVENLLRNRDVSNLSDSMKKQRNAMLNLLREYRAMGIYPRNEVYKNERKPCFIDQDGRICAVGYLVERSSGRQMAEKINSQYQYAYLLSMNDADLDSWIGNSGLTKEECAMIQPSYGYPPYPMPQPVAMGSQNHIPRQDGITSSIWSGVNLSVNLVNGIQIGRGADNKAVPIFGLVSGAAQIFYGAKMMPEEQTVYTYNPWQRGSNLTNESLKNLSFINIGLGTSTVILSAWNLLANKKPKEKLLSWDLQSVPMPENNMGLALSVKKKF